MKTRLGAVLAVGLLLGGGASRADEQAEAKALLDKAMKAMNGEAKLAKLRTASLKGKLTGKEGGQEFTPSLDVTWQGLSQYRAEMDVQEGGKNTQGGVVLNGGQGWLKRGDKTVELPELLAAFVQNLFHAGRMPQLLPALAGKAYKPTLLAEGKVGTRAALGLLLSHKERKDVSLFFDKENGLPLKSEVRLTDPRGQGNHRRVPLQRLQGLRRRQALRQDRDQARRQGIHDGAERDQAGRSSGREPVRQTLSDTSIAARRPLRGAGLFCFSSPRSVGTRPGIRPTTSPGRDRPR
jgi:hypothetical protein